MTPEQIKEVAEMAMRCPITLEQSAEVYGMPLVEILRHGGIHKKGFFVIDSDIRVQWAAQMHGAIEEIRRDNAAKSTASEGGDK